MHQFTHVKVKPFKCTLCDKSFKTKFELQKPNHTHTGERPFLCVLCEKSFSHEYNLNVHKITHGSESLFSVLNVEST